MTAADTVLVCRPAQLREAAVVLSCFPAAEDGHALPPLFVLEPPLCTEAKYRALYESYREMRNLRDADSSTEMARQQTRARKGPRPWSNEEIDRRTEALSPFRKWVKRNRLIGRLLGGRVRHALFLFEAGSEDISAIDPQPVDHLSRVRRPFLPEDIASCVLHPGADLAQRAWSILHPGAEPFPANASRAAPDPGSVIAGLYRARQLGAPLIIDPSGEALRIVPPGTDASEAVLVEAATSPEGSADASLLLAVHYSVRRRALLCVIPPVDTSAIERARERVQLAAEAAQQPQAAPVDAAPLLAAMEQSVSAVLAEDIAAGIGDLPLTAFTAGVPWHFYRSQRFDWSSKPVGLIAGDPLLLLTQELFGEAEAREASFNLLLDPGFFTTHETEGVMAQLRTSTTFPLLMQGEAASNAALILLGPAPLDIVYFNTHGSENTILLRDMPLAGYKLLQRVTLAAHPLIFNNSCLSWTGVGREFVSAGARAYIGTLWSVRADEAGDYAIAVMRRIAAERQSFAASVRNTGVSALTAQAYVYVGPVSAALRPLPRAVDECARLIAGAGTLLRNALDLSNRGPQPGSPLTQPVLQALDAAAQRLCDEIDSRWPDAGISRLNLLTDQISVAIQLQRDAQRPGYCAALCMRGLKMLNGIAIRSKSDRQIKTGFIQICARVAKSMGKAKEALDLLFTSVRELEEAGENPGSEYLEVSDLFRAASEYDKALESALRAREAFAKPGSESARGRVLAAGRIGQLWRRAGKFDQAAAAARDGYLAALELDDLAEQSNFRMDESRIAMERQDYPAAVTAAEDALDLARRNRNENLEVSAIGTLTRALIFRQDWPRARSAANDGLKAAQRRKLQSQIADYLVDLSDIARGEGNLKEAMSRLREAAIPIGATGNAEKAGSALRKAGRLLGAMDNWIAEQDLIRIVTKVISTFDRNTRSSVCTQTVQSILYRVRKDGWKNSRDYLWQSRRDLETACSSLGPHTPEQVPFLRDLIISLHERSRGNRGKALDIAKRLDELSANGFNVAALVATE